MQCDSSQRTTVFISHATPSDNDFTVWLASRLSIAGYTVWCDAEKLLGGDDFWRDIERVIRRDTIKFLLVVSEKAFRAPNELRDGIAKEVALAETMRKQLGLDNFIVPMRIDKTSFSEFPVDFHRLNGIDCSDNWATGLAQLLKLFDREELPRNPNEVSETLEAWRGIHQHRARTLLNAEETVQSNWLELQSMPDEIYAYEILRPMKSTLEPRSIASDCSLPCTEHARLLLSFAPEDSLADALGPTIPIKTRSTLLTEDFIAGRMGDLPRMRAADAKRKLSSLIRQGIENALSEREIATYTLSGNQQAYWFRPGMVEDDKLRYQDFTEQRRSRAVVGVSGKKKDPNDPDKRVTRYYWHLGFTITPTSSDKPSLSIRPRIIVTDDQKTPLQSKVRLNSARRTITKMWFNERWRGLVMGIGNWLSEGSDVFEVPVGRDSVLMFNARPQALTSPIAIAADPAVSTSDEELSDEEDAEFARKLADPAFLVRNEEQFDDE